MLYRFLADAVLLLHLAFIAFVVLGGLLALKSPWAAVVHVPAAVWGAYVELSGRICPLTPLENRLRAIGGEAGYGGGFVEHYLLPLIYPGGLTRGVQLALAIAVVAINAVVYLQVLKRRGARR